jgi:beta-galactosidase
MRTIRPANAGWEFSRANSRFESVTLPHQALPEPLRIENPRTGQVVYRYAFDAPGKWRGKIVEMNIGAAMQTARIFINDRYGFTHFGGYQRFVIPLTDDLRFGERNVVRIELDNRPSDDVPPGKPVNSLDYCYHSGLHRDAWLAVYDRIHISDELSVQVPAGGGVFIRTEGVADGNATIVAECHLVNEYTNEERFVYLGKPAEGPVSARLTITGPDGGILAEADAPSVGLLPNNAHTFRFRAEIADAPLWSTETPNLCTARFDIFIDGQPQDSRETRFGIRTIRFTRDGFFLNGVLTPLLGTNRHSEYPFVGNALTPNANRRDARLIRRAGHNFVRLSHYTQDPAFLDACDELGLLVMLPIPGWQYFSTSEAFVNHAIRDVREMVRAFRNHPSVILWETSLNESYPPSWLNTALHRAAHEEYPGDQCFTCGDSIGNFEGWDVLFHHGAIRDKTKPIIIREYGDWCFGGNASTSRRARGDGSAALLGQAWNFQWTLNRSSLVPGVIGANDWCFIDYNRGYSTDIERSGSVDLFRLPKPKFFFYRSQNCAEPMLFAVRDGAKVVVFSNCAEVEIRQSGASIARRHPDDGPDTAYNPKKASSPNWETALLWGTDYSGGNPCDGGNAKHLAHPPFTFNGIPDGDLDIVGIINGREVAHQTLRTPGPAVGLRIVVRDEGVPPVEGDLVFVDAELVDGAGDLVPDARPVTFSSDGCEIVGAMEATEAGIASCLVRAGVGGAIKVTARL